MIFDAFDVVIVPFPFVDTPVAKPRPALVLSDAGFNRANEHSVLAMITRATHTRWPSDHLITDLATCGLRAASFIRFKIFTLDNRILQRRIGQLGEADRSVFRTALAELCPGAS